MDWCGVVALTSLCVAVSGNGLPVVSQLRMGVLEEQDGVVLGSFRSL